MKFRYDFGEKLDLTRFKKQAPVYIGFSRRSTFDLYLEKFKMTFDVSSVENSTEHLVSFYFEEIFKDQDGEIKSLNVIIPLRDNRFSEFKIIGENFEPDHHEARFQSSSTQYTVERICKILIILHKINKLKVFL